MSLVFGWIAVSLGFALGGCASPQPTELRVESGQYAQAFEAARDALRDLSFSLDRVDAYSGVISTRSKSTGGGATPWDQEQSTPNQEIEDMLNRHTRAARVTFEPIDAAARARRATDPMDLRDLAEPTLMRVDVVLSRRQQPGWRLETTAVRNSSRASDPMLAAWDLEPGYEVAFDSDDLLAGRIAAMVAERLAAQPRAARP